MNGSAYAILSLVVVGGLFMITAAVLRLRLCRPGCTGRWWALRITVVAVWVAGAVLIPIVARPGSQTGWSLVIEVVLLGTLLTGAHDLLATRRKHMRASPRTDAHGPCDSAGT